MNYSLVILLSYLIGSIPNGLLIGKWLKNVDLREYGSKNIGATNAYRVLGLGPAIGVFITDALKGVIGVYLGSTIVGEPLALLLGGIAAMAGHNWSLFLKFKGGRGVSTGLGVIAMIVPKVTVIIFIIWALIFYFTRYVSLASIIAAGLVPIMMYLLGEKNEFLYFGVLAAAFVIIRHKANIIRLLHGEELKIK
jgi:glycerol-3-phosphate acyltransferase PlsY